MPYNQRERAWLTNDGLTMRRYALTQEQALREYLGDEAEFQRIVTRMEPGLTAWGRAMYFSQVRQALEWQDMDADCSCVLPEQSCPVCRAVARRVYGTDWG